ncbi:hypothetical protein Q0M94_19060 (plasmid) [Deinococcus radiomollis]|uniref:hypothetical protein n=1 Tax=Deinococcus radiomollis TaxID=468916 RepID=UPI00389246A1
MKAEAQTSELQPPEPSSSGPQATDFTAERLISSSMLTPATRGALNARLDPPPAAPRLFTSQEFALLELVSVCLVPHDPAALPLAARIDARLNQGITDGWRYDQLPPDAEAYQQLLASLPADFRMTDDAGRHAALTQAQRDHPKIFEELLAELAEGYYSDPLNQLSIGYVGFADARGWTETRLDRLDPHEQEALLLAGESL